MCQATSFLFSSSSIGSPGLGIQVVSPVKMLRVFFLFAVVIALVRDVSAECSRGFECVPLSTCPSLKSIALKLESTRQLNKKIELLNDIKKHLCGDLSKRVKVCCSNSEVDDNPDQVQAASNGASFNRLTYHDLSGEVEIKDEKTIIIKNFVYDGEGPDAFFIVGTDSDTVDASKAIPVPYPAHEPQTLLELKDDIDILPAFTGTDLTLIMPEGVDAFKVKWLSVYCRQYDIDFGHVLLNRNNVPRN